MRITSYMGEIFRVPDWAKYIAADEDGMVVAHEEYPQKWAHEWAPQDNAKWLVLKDSPDFVVEINAVPKRI